VVLASAAFVVEQKSALLARLRLVRAFASAHAPASAALQQCRWRRDYSWSGTISIVWGVAGAALAFAPKQN
jgi:hypothetical protein